MRKGRKIIFSLLLISTISALFLFHTVSSKDFKTIVSSLINSQNYAAAKEITSLSTPTGLGWKDESTATATWDVVENANYYYVNVYIYDDLGNLIGGQETGTSYNELDVQQEIVKILKNSNIKKYSVAFEVKAQYYNQDKIIESSYSVQSNFINFEIKGTIKYATPQDVTIDELYNVTFDSIPNADYYALYFKIGNNTSWTHDAFLAPSQGTISNGKITFNIKNYIKESYKYSGYTGETVQVSYKVKVIAKSGNTTYLDSELSTYSNSVPFSDSNIIKYATPQNVTIDELYNVTFDSIPNADYYALYFKIGNNTSWTHDAFLAPSQGTISNGKITFNIKNYIKESYKDSGYTGEIVQVSYKVKVIAKSGNTTYLDSELSTYSNSVPFSDSNIIKYATPQNVTIDELYNVTFDSIPNADYYALYFKIGNNTSWTHDAFLAPSQGTISNGKITFNIENDIKERYTRYGYTGETVQVSYKVKVIAKSGNTIYLDSEESDYSNIGYYNPNGSTIINNITLAPNKPVIAVGRSIYIGKTINPSNALYDIINWSSSNDSVVSITDMGQITGIKKGNATITAKINNATQTAEVNVYEIKSNVKDDEDSQNIIDEANDVIETVVADGDISNTDITNENKDKVLNEIETGAQNGDLFKVDMKFNQSTQERINEIKEEIKTDYSGYSIAGVNDINIEISHKDNDGVSHHIANITELENEVGVTMDLSSSIPALSNTKTREYKLLRKHNGVLENIDFTINNGIVETSSDKFSEFVLLYADTDIPADEITVNKESVVINVGETETITVNVLPENAANRNYTSTSSDDSVATVSNNVITAVGPGQAIITFTSEDGNYTKTVTVDVKAPLESISLDKTSGTQNVGETESLTVIYNPTDTTDDKTVTWSSSDSNVATVDDLGNVTAVSPGQATITATVGDKTATYIIDVKLPLSSISLNKTSGELIAERQELLTVTYNPSNTTDDKTITWITSDPSIATVEDGCVKAISAGTVTITAKVGEKTADYNLTVIPRIKLTSISLNKTEADLNIGQEQELVVTYNPTDTNDDKTVIWETSDSSIAKVENGKVTALNIGQATITAKVGDKTATFIVNVKSPLISISLDKEKGTLKVDESETLTVIYNPTNTTDNKEVTWTSSDDSIAIVENGKVTALKVGEATITAKVGDKIANYQLTVIEKETLKDVATKKGFKIKDGFIYGFELKKLMTNIKKILGLDYSTNSNSDIIATGIQFKYNDELFTAVVYGDLNGDGKINSADLLKMRQHLLGTSTLKGAYKEAGSIANGKTINSADLLRIRQHLLGKKSIEQKRGE